MNHRHMVRSGRQAPVGYAAGNRAAVSLEGALSITVLVVALSWIIGIVSAYQLQNRVERAAWAIARANSLALGPAASADDLEARAWAAVAAEPGTDLDPDRLDLVVTAYDRPTDLQGGVPSGRASEALGGDADDMVVVRVRYFPSGINPVQRLLDGDVVRSLAVTRNEAEAED